MARTKSELRFKTFASFPTTGATGILYIATDTNELFRWDGSMYVLVGDGGTVNFDAITDPATDAAVTTAKVDAFSGTVITLTTTGNSQTIASPTDTTAGKEFVVINNDTSTNSIVVNGGTVAIGEGVTFTWDGTAWINTGGGGLSELKRDQSGGLTGTYGTLSGTINGSNTTFTTSATSYLTGTLEVYLNGQLLALGATGDWTETTPWSGTFDLNIAPISGDVLFVEYRIIS